MADESGNARESADAIRRRMVDECEPDLRPALARVMAAMDDSMAAIRERLRIKRRLERLPEGSSPEEIARLQDALAEAEAKCESAREALRVASLAHDDASFDWRLSRVPEANRETARTILLEECAEALATMGDNPVAGGRYGSAAGRVFALERRLLDARGAGDPALVARLEAEIAPLRAEKARLEALVAEFNALRKARAEDYERRLQTLLD